jgi:hypothetical protein
MQMGIICLRKHSAYHCPVLVDSFVASLIIYWTPYITIPSYVCNLAVFDQFACVQIQPNLCDPESSVRPDNFLLD